MTFVRLIRTVWLPIRLFLFYYPSIITSSLVFSPPNGSFLHTKQSFREKYMTTSTYSRTSIRRFSQLAEAATEVNNAHNSSRLSSINSLGRRKLLMVGLASFLPFIPMNNSTSNRAQAITKEFPLELTYTDSPSLRTDEMEQNKKIRELISSQEASRRKNTMDSIYNDPLLFQSLPDVVATVLWGGALWLLAGSRSNPLVTPIANALYEPDQQFLKDRNDGYFSALPPSLMFILFALFLSLGFVVDRTLTLLFLGDSDIVLQLAGVSLISGAALELGRISAGEKVGSREELDRMNQLREEFDAFADQRLVSGGNVHRQEIVNAFRRFHSKYRNRDNDELLSDIEIERLMRLWARVHMGSDMSSAGYFNGIQLNTNADIVKTSQL